MSYVFTIWHKFRPLGLGESVTYSRRSSPEAKFCRCVKREKLIPGIEKVPSMESTMVGVNYQIISTYSVEFMPGVHKCLKIRDHALSLFTQTYVL